MLIILAAFAVLAIVLASASILPPRSHGSSGITYSLTKGGFYLNSSNALIELPVFHSNRTLVITYPVNSFGGYPAYTHAISMGSYSNVIEYSFSAVWNTSSKSPYEFDDIYTFLATNVKSWNGEEIGITDDMRGSTGNGIIKAYLQPANSNVAQTKVILFNNDRHMHNFKILLSNNSVSFYVDGNYVIAIYSNQSLLGNTFYVVAGANRWASANNFSADGYAMTISNMTITEG